MDLCYSKPGKLRATSVDLPNVKRRTPLSYGALLFLALILFLVPISYTNATYNPIIIKTVVAQGLLLLVFISILLNFSHPTPTLRRGAPLPQIIFLPILFYLVLSIISITPSPYKHAGIKEMSNLVTYILLFFATFYIIKKDNIRKVLTMWCISTLLAAIIGIMDFRHRRIASVGFGNTNLLAGYMVIALPVIAGLLLTNLNKVGVGFIRPVKTGAINVAPTILKFLYVIPIIAVLYVLYLCNSRGAWLALAGGTVSFLILLFLNNNKKKLIMLILSIGIIGTIIFSLFLVPLTEELILDVRPFIWRGTLNMIKAHPIIGAGYGTYLINYPDYRVKEYFFYSHTLGKERGWQAQDVTDHAHSEYLEIAAETGIIGLTIFFSIIIIFFSRIVKALRGNKMSGERFILIGLAAGVMGALIDNTVNISMRFISSSLFFWFSMAAALAIIYPDKNGRHKCRPYSNCINICLVSVILLLGLMFYRTTFIDFRASAYLMKGIESRANGEWQDAINHYKKAVSIDPYLLTAHYRLAFAYNETGDLDKAIETYKGILQIAPHYAKTEANIGKVYVKKGMSNEALLYFKKAENLNPYDIDLLCSISSLYMGLGDISNAKCYVRRALTIEPGNEYASSVMKKLK